MVGFVSREPRSQEGLIHVHLNPGVTLMQPAGEMVDILQWLTATSPGRSALTGIQTFVTGPETSR